MHVHVYVVACLADYESSAMHSSFEVSHLVGWRLAASFGPASVRGAGSVGLILTWTLLALALLVYVGLVAWGLLAWRLLAWGLLA